MIEANLTTSCHKKTGTMMKRLAVNAGLFSKYADLPAAFDQLYFMKIRNMPGVNVVFDKSFGHSVAKARNYARHILCLIPTFVFIINKLRIGIYLATSFRIIKKVWRNAWYPETEESTLLNLKNKWLLLAKQ